MDEKTAIQLTLKGNPTALEWLVEHNQLKAVRAAYLITGDHFSAEDVVQEAFLDLPDLMRTFDANRPFEPWFLRVIVHRALRALTRERKWVQFPDLSEMDRIVSRWTNDQFSPETALQQRELETRMWNEMKKLSPEQRAAIVMRYYLGMSEEEMALAASVPAGTIKWRLSAARRQLRQLFQEDPRKD
jgi:RNA polymerase sigma-70 factor (ECF subfamily)